MDKSRKKDLDPNMETTLGVLTDIIQETLEGMSGEPMAHLVIAIPKDPDKIKKFKKIILAGNMSPGLAREILELASEHIGDNPQESSAIEIKAKEGVCSHCGGDHEIDLDAEFIKKLEAFKPVMSTVVALRETEEGREYINHFIENCGTDKGKEAIVTAAMNAPNDELGNLKRNFLAKYMAVSMGIPEDEIPSFITH